MSAVTPDVSDRLLAVGVSHHHAPLEVRERLYLQDGQNVFDPASVGKEWEFDETADALIDSGRIEPLILVAVANTPARRAPR